MLPSRAEPMVRTALQILWPAFVLAGVLEMLVFAMVDPSDLHWLGGGPIKAPRQAVYTVAFFAFWGIVAAAGAITALLRTRDDNTEPPP